MRDFLARSVALLRPVGVLPRDSRCLKALIVWHLAACAAKPRRRPRTVRCVVKEA
jgi:hypothetical protein